MARFESVTGKYVYFDVQGKEYRVYFEENGQGIPLVCQHTAGSDGRQWRHLMNDIDVTSLYRVVAFDLPYHGKSLPPESVEWWKEEYMLHKSFLFDFHTEFIRALGLERPVYIGCSMGGHLAPDLALERPDAYRAVIGVEGNICSPEDPIEDVDVSSEDQQRLQDAHHDVDDGAWKPREISPGDGMGVWSGRPFCLQRGLALLFRRA